MSNMNISWKYSVLGLLSLVLMSVCAYNLFTRLQAEQDYAQAQYYFSQGFNKNASESTQKLVLYKKANVFFQRVIIHNATQAEYFFGYAEFLKHLAQEFSQSRDLLSSIFDYQSNELLSERIEENYMKAILSEPTEVLYHVSLADMYRMRKQYDAAYREVKRGLLLDPQSLVVESYAAGFFIEQKDFSQGIRHLIRSVFLNKYMGNLAPAGVFDQSLKFIEETPGEGVYRKGKGFVWRFTDPGKLKNLAINIPFGFTISVRKPASTVSAYACSIKINYNNHMFDVALLPHESDDGVLFSDEALSDAVVGKQGYSVSSKALVLGEIQVLGVSQENIEYYELLIPN